MDCIFKFPIYFRKSVVVSLYPSIPLYLQPLLYIVFIYLSILAINSNDPGFFLAAHIILEPLVINVMKNNMKYDLLTQSQPSKYISCPLPGNQGTNKEGGSTLTYTT